MSVSFAQLLNFQLFAGLEVVNDLPDERPALPVVQVVSTAHLDGELVSASVQVEPGKVEALLGLYF